MSNFEMALKRIHALSVNYWQTIQKYIEIIDKFKGTDIRSRYITLLQNFRLIFYKPERIRGNEQELQIFR